MNPKTLSVFVLMLGSAGAHAADVNLLNLYVGASAGPTGSIYIAPGVSEGHDTAWKVMAGIRPFPLLGAEMEYIDFGSAAGGPEFAGTAHARAEGLFAVAYLPIPLARVDLFAKAGVDDVHTAADGKMYCGIPGIGAHCDLVSLVHVSESEAAAAYGAGAQLKLYSLALRAEYERIRTSVGQPGLLSFGLTWTF